MAAAHARRGRRACACARAGRRRSPPRPGSSAGASAPAATVAEAGAQVVEAAARRARRRPRRTGWRAGCRRSRRSCRASRRPRRRAPRRARGRAAHVTRSTARAVLSPRSRLSPRTWARPCCRIPAVSSARELGATTPPPGRYTSAARAPRARRGCLRRQPAAQLAQARGGGARRGSGNSSSDSRRFQAARSSAPWAVSTHAHSASASSAVITAWRSQDSRRSRSLDHAGRLGLRQQRAGVGLRRLAHAAALEQALDPADVGLDVAGQPVAVGVERARAEQLAQARDLDAHASSGCRRRRAGRRTAPRRSAPRGARRAATRISASRRRSSIRRPPASSTARSRPSTASRSSGRPGAGCGGAPPRRAHDVDLAGAVDRLGDRRGARRQRRARRRPAGSTAARRRPSPSGSRVIGRPVGRDERAASPGDRDAARRSGRAGARRAPAAARPQRGLDGPRGRGRDGEAVRVDGARRRR